MPTRRGRLGLWWADQKCHWLGHDFTSVEFYQTNLDLQRRIVAHRECRRCNRGWYGALEVGGPMLNAHSLPAFEYQAKLDLIAALEAQV